MPLQVIGGEHGGRRLKSPPAQVRPTLAIVRRSLFDILGPRVVGAAVLDLYAGSGALGIEAISRGAASADFVESNRACASVVAANLKLLTGESSELGRVHCAAVVTWLQRNSQDLGRFDITFVDPPYGAEELPAVMDLLGAGAMRPGVILAVEERSSRLVAAPAGPWTPRRVRHGDTALTIFTLGRS